MNQVVLPTYGTVPPCASEILIQPQIELLTPQVASQLGPQLVQQQPTIIEVSFKLTKNNY